MGLKKAPSNIVQSHCCSAWLPRAYIRDLSDQLPWLRGRATETCQTVSWIVSSVVHHPAGDKARGTHVLVPSACASPVTRGALYLGTRSRYFPGGLTALLEGSSLVCSVMTTQPSRGELESCKVLSPLCCIQEDVVWCYSKKGTCWNSNRTQHGEKSSPQATEQLPPFYWG